MYVMAFSFSLVLGIQIYINVKLLYETDLLKISSLPKSIPVVINNPRAYGFKDILELAEENKSIKIVKLIINPEDKTKINVEIEYNGAKDYLNHILKLFSSKENLCSINNISLISVDESKVKAMVNMDFIKNK